MTVPRRTDHGNRPWLRVDPIACTGHGICAELLPEHITLDEWGYPLIDPNPIPTDLLPQARHAVATCPALALRLQRPDST
ncbi:MAG TPA: ferredoxin [Pseudonocardiaceae bacterium]|nr:ferredoxin [Pseudonocardiaceae bacterium]